MVTNNDEYKVNSISWKGRNIGSVMVKGTASLAFNLHVTRVIAINGHLTCPRARSRAAHDLSFLRLATTSIHSTLHTPHCNIEEKVHYS